MQRMPAIRSFYWPSLLPQLLMVMALCGLIHFLFPRLQIGYVLILGGLIFNGYCVAARKIFLQDQIAGMIAYRQMRFESAIEYFESSYQYFRRHPQLDRWRFIIFGVNSYNPFRIVALGNLAFCHGQLGHKEKAIDLYEQVLREMPDHTVAQTMLRMLQPVPEPKVANPAENSTML